MAIDSLKLIIEADAQGAIKVIDDYSQKVDGATKANDGLATAANEAAPAVKKTGDESEETSKQFFKLKTQGEGASIGIFKFAGIAAAAFVALRQGVKVISDSAAAYEKLNPEAAKAAGSQTNFKMAMEEVQAKVGETLSVALNPLREWFIGIVTNTTAAERALKAYNNELDRQIELGLKKYASDDYKLQQDMEIARLDLASYQLDLQKKSTYGNVMNLANTLKETTAAYNKAAEAAKKYKDAGGQTAIITALEADRAKAAMEAAKRESEDNEKRIEALRVLIRETEKYLKKLEEQANAEKKVSFLQLGMPAGVGVGINNWWQVGAKVGASGFTSAMAGQVDGLSQWTTVLGELGKQAASAGLRELTDGMKALGEAIGSGKADAMEDWFSGFMSRLPQLLLQAGLTVIASFPGNPVAFGIGAALILASGLVSLGVGMSEGNKTRMTSAESAANGTANGGGRSSYTLVNVYGNVWSEADLTTAVISRAGQY